MEVDANIVAVAGVVGHGAIIRVFYQDAEAVTIDYVLHQFAIYDII